MRRFLAGLAIYGVGLFALGSALLPATAEARHWVFCAPANKNWAYAHIAHSPKKCSVPGYWLQVTW